MCELLKEDKLYQMSPEDEKYFVGMYADMTGDISFEFFGDLYDDGRMYKSGDRYFHTSKDGTVISKRQLGNVMVCAPEYGKYQSPPTKYDKWISRKEWWVDECLVPVLEHLNKIGYGTTSSCCGHGEVSCFGIGVCVCPSLQDIECVEKIIREYHSSLEDLHLELHVHEGHLHKFEDGNFWDIHFTFYRRKRTHIFSPLVPGTICNYKDDLCIHFDSTNDFVEYLKLYKEPKNGS